MDDKLVIVLGFYRGGKFIETLLKNNYKVIGVDASKEIINYCKDKYKNYKNLTLINKCISDKDNSTVIFYLSDWDVWNSLNKNIADRLDKCIGEDTIETITLSTLLNTYGCPFYLRMDIEGFDELALIQILDTKYRPKYISCESECLGNEYENIYDKVDGLTNLNLLHDLGYTKFYLHKEDSNLDDLDIFSKSISWVSYDEVKNNIIQLRSKFCEDVKNGKSLYFGFWYDIYATN